MAPPNDSRNRSGEHRAEGADSLHPSVFYNFVDEFRIFTRALDNKLDNINKNLAEGATRFAVYEQKSTENGKRSDEHSDQLDVLMTDKTQRDALQAATAPTSALKQEIIRNVILAGVLGGCAIIYNLWRDHEVSKEKTASAKPTPSVPAAIP